MLTPQSLLGALEMTQSCSRPGSSLLLSGRPIYEHKPSSAKEGTMKTASPRDSDPVNHSVSWRVDTVGDTINSTTVPGGQQRGNHNAHTSAFDPTKEYCTPTAIYFRHPQSLFSQWSPARFTLTLLSTPVGNTCLLPSKLPCSRMKLGLRPSRLPRARPNTKLDRQVCNFKQELWDVERKNVVLGASYAKFLQNPDMHQHLLGTGGQFLVEASPYDTV